ncbi:aspartate aminotransferase family protein [Maribacter sp. Asnod1-A12]|uniref:aspartate aminotransferase family protein n=1 Tax=Maribacter sp. Asnod1-A12 TaxID=3160576 RepID=UPI00386E02FE
MITKKASVTTLFEKRKKLVPDALGIFNPSTASRSKGATIWDINDRPQIDFAGGIGVLNAGHSPEPVVKAIQAQAEKLIHTCFNVSLTEEYLNLAEKLVDLFPHSDATKVMLTTSGAESVENAIKIARMATGKQGIVSFTGAFHGRTMMAMTLTSKNKYKDGCGPFAPEVYRLEFPNHFRFGKGMTEEAYLDEQIQKMKDFFNHQVSTSQIAAVIFELVQGEGGFTVMPPKYLEALQEVCKANHILMIADEVQSGFGRTGKWASYQHYNNFTPDISTWAKSMGSGMPIGAVIGKAEIMDKANPSAIGGTYPGNPICCVASLATIEYMETININKLGENVGNIVKSRFEHFKQKFDTVADVRGLGAMLAIELINNNNPWEPNATLASALIKRCEEKGLIIISAGTFGNCIRVLSPLTISEKQLNEGLDILEEAIGELTA